MLAFRYAVFDVEVVTQIETDETTLDNMKSMKLSLWCPHCQRSHQILGNEGYVTGSQQRDAEEAAPVLP